MNMKYWKAWWLVIRGELEPYFNDPEERHLLRLWTVSGGYDDYDPQLIQCAMLGEQGGFPVLCTPTEYIPVHEIARFEFVLKPEVQT